MEKHKYTNFNIYKTINYFKGGHFGSSFNPGEILMEIPKAGSIYSSDKYLVCKPRAGLNSWVTINNTYKKLGESCVLPINKIQMDKNLYAMNVDTLTHSDVLDLGLFISNPNNKTNKQYK